MKLPGLHIFKILGGWATVYNIVDDEGEPIRVLRVGRAYQSATYLGERRFELPFEYYRTIVSVLDGALAQRDNDNVQSADGGCAAILAIGGGGCSVPKHIAIEREGMTVDVVERDPAIAKVARKLFFADEAEATRRMRIVSEEGTAFLEKPGPSYFAIVNDAFVGEDPVWDLLEDKALALSRGRLVPGGIYVMNVVCTPDDEGAAHMNRVAGSLKRHFAHVGAIPAADDAMSDKENLIVVASDRPYRFSGLMEF